MVILLPFAFAACNDKTDKVVDFEIDPFFYELVIYQGDEVDIGDFYLALIYESGKIETIPLTSQNVEGFSTAEVGERQATVTHGQDRYTFTYTIHPITAVAATYLGSPLTFYLGEEPNFEGVSIFINYTNGHDRERDLGGLLHSDIDYTLDGTTKQLTFYVEGLTVNIPYTVTCRSMQENTFYIVKNDTKQVKLVTEDEKQFLYFYREIDGQLNDVNRIRLAAGDFNQYTYNDIIDGKRCTFVVYLSGGQAVIEEMS